MNVYIDIQMIYIYIYMDVIHKYMNVCVFEGILINIAYNFYCF